MQFPWCHAPPNLLPARLAAQNLASSAQDLDHKDVLRGVSIRGPAPI
jgi:hypothetical protein